MELYSTTIRCNDKLARIADSTVLNLKREPSSVDPSGGKKKEKKKKTRRREVVERTEGCRDTNGCPEVVVESAHT